MDFNSIITAALTAAIEQVTAPLAARVNELGERIKAMEDFYPKDAEGKVVTHPIVATAGTEPATPMHPSVEEALVEKLQLVERNVANLSAIAYGMFKMESLDKAAERICENDVLPDPTHRLCTLVVEAIGSHADDVIEQLAESVNTYKLLNGIVSDVVSSVIRNGTFDISFNRF